MDGDRPLIRGERRRIDLESPDSLVDPWLIEVNQADVFGKSPDFDLHQPLIDLESSSFEDKI